MRIFTRHLEVRWAEVPKKAAKRSVPEKIPRPKWCRQSRQLDYKRSTNGQVSADNWTRREIIDQENGVDDLHSVRNMSGFNVVKEAQRHNDGLGPDIFFGFVRNPKILSGKNRTIGRCASFTTKTRQNMTFFVESTCPWRKQINSHLTWSLRHQRGDIHMYR